MPPKSQTSPSILPSSYTLKSSTELCSLWSNYGSISRLTVTQNTEPTRTTLILKSILPPPSTSPDDESHLRKLISYAVERYFYTHLSTHLSTLPFTKVATPIAVNSSAGQLLLEDLSPSYPISAYGSLTPSATTAVLKWLAGFHATFWSPSSNTNNTDINININIGTPIPPPLSVSSPTTTNGIWQQGGYWYLSTRSEEHSALLSSSSKEYDYMIPWIHHVDSKIRNEKIQWKTLIHGDVKAANILFSSSSSSSSPKQTPTSTSSENTVDVKAALYDFQYCGISTPAVDLVYFLSTTVDRKSLTNWEDLLREYYVELCEVYTKTHGGEKLDGDDGLGYTFNVLKEQWDVALVDWMRFMAGWGCWGNWRWVESCTKDIIRRWEEEGGRTPIQE
ncbi:hypothetical protein AA313_de0203156 [Arthrobotrys entomopaga]|nr:hypothetical protein AA313_de0203156 [Arthrobotrys entomopaga]